MSRVLGIDVGGTKIAIGCSDADGPVLAGHVRLRTGDDPLATALAAARDLAGAPAAVGFSTTGVIRQGVVRLAPNVPGWDGLELPRLLREAYAPVPVAIDNDVNAAAAAELRWGALRGVSCGLYLNLGTGLAAALVVDGRVFAGAHGAAGEIGYVLTDPGSPGFAAGHAPLEDRFSGAGLARQASAELGTPTTAAELFAGDVLPHLVEAALADLTTAVANLCVSLDPECLVVGGGLMGAAPVILPALEERLRRTVPFPPRVRRARFADDASLLGALALARSMVE
ncbi:ROK family protein [Nonomuraea sp. NPDC050328]|uniref:ROK family protein n=1 Tax=Nonomuraea sp. NPDC050328 TaxID=3364361 RepID=UPI0037908E4C